MRRAQGFTLIELLVALAVMALLSIMSWRGLDAMGRAQAQTQMRADDLQALRNGLAQWGADLDAMDTDLVNTRADSTRPSPMEWNGLALRITRYSSGAGAPGLRVVAWTARNENGRKQWLRWQSPLVQTRGALQQAWTQAGQWAQSPTDTNRAQQVQIVPVEDWQLFYYRGDAWTNPGSSSDAATTTPEGVRLQLSLPTDAPLSGKITRDWMRSNVSGAKS